MSEFRRVFDALDAMGIAYDAIEHEPAAHIDRCMEVMEGLNATVVKNFFLCPRNRSRFYLLLTRPEAKLRTSDISAQAGASRLGFAPEDRLAELLHEQPGSISPMGLIFDAGHAVTVLVDEALRCAARLAFHPCDNTRSLAMSGADFFDVFLKQLGYAPVFVTIHDFLEPKEENP